MEEYRMGSKTWSAAEHRCSSCKAKAATTLTQYISVVQAASEALMGTVNTNN